MRDAFTTQFRPEIAVSVQAAGDLLRHERHRLVRDPDETDAEYAARSELFGILLDHARQS